MQSPELRDALAGHLYWEQFLATDWRTAHCRPSRSSAACGPGHGGPGSPVAAVRLAVVAAGRSSRLIFLRTSLQPRSQSPLLNWRSCRPSPPIRLPPKPRPRKTRPRQPVSPNIRRLPPPGRYPPSIRWPNSRRTSRGRLPKLASSRYGRWRPKLIDPAQSTLEPAARQYALTKGKHDRAGRIVLGQVRTGYPLAAGPGVAALADRSRPARIRDF